MSLLRSQRNDIYKAVQEAGYHPRDFRWENRDAEPIGFEGSHAETLVHAPTGFAFMIMNASIGPRERSMGEHDSPGDYLTHYEPGTESRSEAFLGINLRSAKSHVYKWLGNIRRETEEEDLWAQLAQASAPFGPVVTSRDTENTPFAPDEIKRIAAGLEEVKAQLRAQVDLDTRQVAAIEEGFAALIAAAQKIGRKDWSLMLGGVVLGVIANAALPPEAVKGLFHIVGQVFRWLFQQGRFLPPLG